MSSHSTGRFGRVLALIVVLCALGTFATAQYQRAPKWEIFGGYSFVYPGGDVHGTLPLGVIPLSSRMESNPRGVGAAVTYNFNRWFGLTLDASDHWGQGEKTVAKRIDDADLANLSFGPKLTYRWGRFSPFVEALVGDQRLYPEAFHRVNKLGFMAGGGVDLKLTRHVAWRILRADFVAANYNFGPKATTERTEVRGVRLQTGLNFMFGGGAPEVAASAACTVQPMEVFAGEFVTATATGSNFRREVKYEWSGTGVKVSGNSSSIQIDTAGLAAGSYQVTANLSDGSRRGVASCSARFMVKRPNPPIISCSSSPATVQQGGTSTISSNASSPDGRKLTYSYTASAGNIGGSTASANLDSIGAQPGTITVICNVGDDRNPPLTASSTTTVNVLAPPPPVPTAEFIAREKRLALHSVYFATARPTIEHPDGGLLISQEKTLSSLASDFKIYLQSKPDASLTLEGHADPRGSVPYNQALTERRVNRVKHFLVEQGVPEASIQTKAFGEQQNLSDKEVKEAVERNPELSTEERQKVLANMKVIILASNRRVDITLNNGSTSQKSVREYPFNAADSLTLLDTRGGTKKNPVPTSKKKGSTKP